jgi:hypothetical protein
VLLWRHAQEWRAHREFPKLAKAFGVDAKKILEQVAPPPKAEPAAKPKAKTAAKVARR